MHRLGTVHHVAERGILRPILRIPAQMLARDAHAGLLAIERMQMVEVAEKDACDVQWRGFGEQLAGSQVVRDLAENPRTALRATANHHRIGVRCIEYVLGLLRRGDVPIGEHGNMHRGFHRSDGVVFGFAFVSIGTRAAVHRQRRDAVVLGNAGNAGNAECVLVLAIPAGADFQSDRHVHCVHHRFYDARNQWLVLQQCRTGPHVAHLLRRAAHVYTLHAKFKGYIVTCTMTTSLRLMELARGDPMAILEFIQHRPRRYEVTDGQSRWVDLPGTAIERLPQLMWKNGSTWSEPNVWALDQAGEKDIKTVHSAMHHLLAYANWLEAEQVDWRDFPARKSQRCLTRFRGALIRARNRGEVAPSTASARMSAIVRFYRWVERAGLIQKTSMWSDMQVGLKFTNAFGFEHTLQITTTDLAIKNSRVAGAVDLEDGVMPLTSRGVSEVLEFAEREASEELKLMLQIGLGTGLRLGSILDLKLGTIANASVDPLIGWHRIAVGPGATPSVATKYGNAGLIPIPAFLLEKLNEYATSTRRLKRQALAAPSERDLLFLTRFGKSYVNLGSRAVNVEISRLRAKARKRGVKVMEGFHFHRTRATFATMLMRICLKFLPVADAVMLVREACLHRDEATTLKYVKFLESNEVMAKAADAFSNVFMSIIETKNKEQR